MAKIGESVATRNAYGEFLVKAGKRNKDVVVLDADLSGSTKTKKFGEKYPDRFFNMGIAEQNLMGTAAGLALSGKTVFASTFAMFATGRAYEIVRNCIGHTHANVKVCATHSGITVGEDGATHQTFEDVSLMRGIPDMNVVVPADANSATALLEVAEKTYGPFYVRLGRSGIPVIYDEKEKFEVGGSKMLKDGKDVAILCSGIMVGAALEAAEALKSKGIDARVVDMYSIKPIDENAIYKAATDTKAIVTAEEHSIIGGLGSAVAEYTSEHCPVKISRVGQQDVFGESGKPDILLQKYGMTAEHIVNAVVAVLE